MHLKEMSQTFERTSKEQAWKFDDMVARLSQQNSKLKKDSLKLVGGGEGEGDKVVGSGKVPSTTGNSK